jgi:hypothetical protein
VESDGITLNKRELRLLKEYMGHHGWNDLLVSHPMPLLVSKFKMTYEEIDSFRKKIGI